MSDQHSDEDVQITEDDINWDMIYQCPFIEHKCHPHPLMKRPSGNLGWICNGCDKPFEDQQVRYWCMPCNYDVCQTCMDKYSN